MFKFIKIRKNDSVLQMDGIIDESSDETVSVSALVEATSNGDVSPTENAENDDTIAAPEIIEAKKKTIAEVQQEYFVLFGHKSETIYDLYEYKHVLHAKVKLVLGLDERKIALETLIKDQIKELMAEENDDLEILWLKKMELLLSDDADDVVTELNEKIKTIMGANSYDKLNSLVNKRVKAIVNEEKKTLQPLVEKIWDLKAYSGNKWLLMSPIYMCFVNKKIFKAAETNLLTTDFCVFPLFRIRRCITENKNSADCCAFFVDLNGRVYENFNAFKLNNRYPAGTIVGPRNGIYNGTEDETGNINVNLEMFMNHTKVTSYIDTGSSIAGLATVGITAASLVPAITVAPIVMIGSAIVGISCAAYSGVRSVYHLWDRTKHRQSNSITESEARQAYFTITGGLLCAGAAGVTNILASAAESGRTISTLATNTVNVVNGSSIIINAFAPVDGIANIILKLRNPDEKISPMELLQVSASLFLFTHSVYNFQKAQAVIESSRAKAIEGIRQDLTNSQRKGFDKLVEETIKVRGTPAGQQDIIRAYRSVNSGQFKQTLTDVFKMKKILNENDIQVSLGPDGNVLLNNKVSVPSGELRNNFKSQAPERVLGNVPKNIAVVEPETLAAESTSTTTLTTIKNNAISSSTNLNVHIVIKCAVELAKLVPEEKMTDIKSTLFKKYATLKSAALERFVNFVEYFYRKYSKDVNEYMHEHYDMVKYITTIYNQIDLICRTNGESIEQYILRLTTNTFIEVEQKVLDFLRSTILIFLGKQSTEIIELFKTASNVRRIYSDKIISTSNNDLVEIVEYVVTKFSDDRNVRLFFTIAIHFIDLYSEKIMGMLKRYVSLDTFVTDIFGRICIESEESKCDEIIKSYTNKDFAEFEMTMMDYYIDQQPNGGQFVDCGVCGGKFYKLN